MQNKEDIDYQYLKIYCTKTQCNELKFCTPHNKSNVIYRLIKHYKIRFDTNIVHGTCAIHCITCACDKCTYTLDKS